MNSIRRRLLVWLMAGMCGLVALAAGGLYPALRRMLVAEFDDALLAKARLMTSFVEPGRQGVNLGFTGSPLPEFTRADAPEYFQVWTGDGEVLARSPSLGSADLPFRVGVQHAPAIWNLALPDGRPGRAGGLGFKLDDPVDRTAGSGPGSSGTASFDVAVVFARDTVRLNRILAGVLAGVLVGGVVCAGSALLLAHLAVRAGVRPVERLAWQAAAMDAASLQRRFDAADAPVELEPIVRQFNGLLDRLEETFRRERRFTGAAAHELATPIAELQSLAENAVRFPEDPEATGRFAQDVLEVSRRMEQLVDVLLALARCESGAQRLALEKISLSAMLEALRIGLEPRRVAKGLALQWAVPPGVTVLTDRTLCQTLLWNLLDNAVEHTPDGGQVVCRLTLDERQVRLGLSNTHTGLAAEDLPRLFEPFWRKDAVRSDRKHTGLGLTLARSVAERLGLQLDAELSPTGWVLMAVAFPVEEDRDGKLPVSLDQVG